MFSSPLKHLDQSHEDTLKEIVESLQEMYGSVAVVLSPYQEYELVDGKLVFDNSDMSVSNYSFCRHIQIPHIIDTEAVYFDYFIFASDKQININQERYVDRFGYHTWEIKHVARSFQIKSSIPGTEITCSFDVLALIKYLKDYPNGLDQNEWNKAIKICQDCYREIHTKYYCNERFEHFDSKFEEKFQRKYEDQFEDQCKKLDTLSLILLADDIIDTIDANDDLKVLTKAFHIFCKLNRKIYNDRSDSFIEAFESEFNEKFLELDADEYYEKARVLRKALEKYVIYEQHDDKLFSRIHLFDDCHRKIGNCDSDEFDKEFDLTYIEQCFGVVPDKFREMIDEIKFGIKDHYIELALDCVKICAKYDKEVDVKAYEEYKDKATELINAEFKDREIELGPLLAQASDYPPEEFADTITIARVENGGTLFIENTLGNAKSPFCVTVKSGATILLSEQEREFYDPNRCSPKNFLKDFYGFKTLDELNILYEHSAEDMTKDYIESIEKSELSF